MLSWLFNIFGNTFKLERRLRFFTINNVKFMQFGIGLFPKSVNLEKLYSTKHSVRWEAILKTIWMPNGVASADCAKKDTGNKFISD